MATFKEYTDDGSALSGCEQAFRRREHMPVSLLSCEGEPRAQERGLVSDFSFPREENKAATGLSDPGRERGGGRPRSHGP